MRIISIDGTLDYLYSRMLRYVNPFNDYLEFAKMNSQNRKQDNFIKEIFCSAIEGKTRVSK